MPRPPMKTVRQQQLIDATLVSVERHGLHHTTINTISGLAGMSSGIISHYFGGKQGLIEATLKYLLDELKQALLRRTQGKVLTPAQRLSLIVDANFTELQRSNAATKTWLSFWSQAMHDPGLARLQHINCQRLYSNLLFSFKPLIGKPAAIEAAKQTAAMIDGFWLRSALSVSPEKEFEQAQYLCKSFIEAVIVQHGENQCH
ncbi:transcriptional regulator BetI [Shewanella colwelliana]|uniref:HTH-type transcriptional regulator BetI n=1 Tax=Shewanella colwelliana TaxID=23 RepID=A0A1E5IQY0_SHECO|nr:transcriptional regulator BetI [Shewanella colwelliana]MCZ4336352.1 transcriptional regulator BetI [Shewanella colwelliana]MDX1280493.1 transcriptional regulator BetI [Shewanella colwelliana]OEG72910.1 transcriptional regulator BetI [Shewanella colwelliana]GIU30632.1 HTH-type transcriptional regulator BetI [Shewanella colwelliana]GIU40698.1 HTH-type transcriptional regulator BetI [Shewanella colwelliana]